MNSIEDRLQRLEDLQSIQTVTFTYAHLIDKGLNGKQVDLENLPYILAADIRWA